MALKHTKKYSKITPPKNKFWTTNTKNKKNIYWRCKLLKHNKNNFLYSKELTANKKGGIVIIWFFSNCYNDIFSIRLKPFVEVQIIWKDAIDQKDIYKTYRLFDNYPPSRKIQWWIQILECIFLFLCVLEMNWRK